MAKEIIVPVWEKYSLTVEEAAAYFRIGENSIRDIIKENPEADFHLKYQVHLLRNLLYS